MQCHSNSSSPSSSVGWSVLNESLRIGEDTISPDIKRFIESSLGTEISGGAKTVCTLDNGDGNHSLLKSCLVAEIVGLLCLIQNNPCFLSHFSVTKFK
jgi:hypothetical protein